MAMYLSRSYQQEGVLDRQISPFHPLGRVTGEARAAASTAHTISLWKIPSIDSALIRQAALGIPPRFLLGWVRSKREPGLGAGASPAILIDPDAPLVARQQPSVSLGPSSPRGCRLGQ